MLNNKNLLVLIIMLSCRVCDSTSCTNEITSVSEFLTMKAAGTFDLIVDVRKFNEYTGNGDPTCNTASQPDKCNMGHDPDMYHLTNADRSDLAVLYRVNGVYTVDPKIITAFQACYGSQASTMKILISCYSGGRSAAMQQALVSAGFTCGNMYNLRPGAEGLFNANATMVRTNDQLGPWTCPTEPSSLAARGQAMLGCVFGGLLLLYSMAWRLDA